MWGRIGLVGVLLVCLLGVTGCARPVPTEVPTPEPPPDPGAQAVDPPGRPSWVTPVTEETFPALIAKHRPNELGRVLILEYHDFKETEERWARRWDNFRKDLETLYAKGYRAVTLLDYLKGEMDLPAGTSPVIFTFDDSLSSQLKLVLVEGKWEADSKSAVGIMLQFQKEHPDFGAAGTFYVNFTPVPFRERENWKDKIKFLVQHGFEVANHAQYHEDLSALSDEGVQEALAMQVKRMQEVLPEYNGSTLALPFGLPPKHKALAQGGEFGGVTYSHQAVLLVGSDPVMSPYDRRVNFMALPRVQAIESEFERWFPHLDQARYISDGDPDTIVVPENLAEYVNATVTAGKKIRTYKAER